ncbi:MAG: hypothetical protein AseanaTS_13180 [Candidatus Pelagadaptatus aseana]|uniref:hypothetical protein n=1 Tax=Candidatus Pelagadaptatus aseana TaxID=3120508 RepID=UPI0039B2CF39
MSQALSNLCVAGLMLLLASVTTAGEQESPSRSQKLEVYSKMQTLCDRWSRWYKRDRSENARINMNISCRDAARYASNELAMTVATPKHIAAKPSKPRNTKPNARLLSARKLERDYTGKPKCSRWQEQVDNIQRKLRGGYREPQGNKLREKRRNLWRLLRDNC